MQSEVVENMKSHVAATENRAAHTMQEGPTLMERSKMYQRAYGYVCLTMA
jgi:hypothetical protein